VNNNTPLTRQRAGLVETHVAHVAGRVDAGGVRDGDVFALQTNDGQRGAWRKRRLKRPEKLLDYH
jgi:hypothetical protein